MIRKYIKNKPTLYKIAKIGRKFYRKCLIPFQWIYFKYRMVTKKPYFGPILNATQCWPKRYPLMRDLIRKELEKENKAYKILEIGSWAGHSTTLWASACKEKKKGKVFCIDTWGGASNTPQLRNKTKKILNLFHHNIKTSGVEDYVVSIKGSSDDVAKILCENTFDLVYVDGDHSYTQFKKDLLNYMKFVKAGGIICGDDLELYPNEIDVKNAKKHCEEDFILDPKLKESFHPGIALGVLEVFGNKINMKNGFWYTKKEKDWDTTKIK